MTKQASTTTTPIPMPSRGEIEAILVQHGYRLTQPRAAVVDAVLQRTRPFSAEQLVTDMSTANGGKIGRATIYRTLEILASVDVLSRLIQEDGHPVYLCENPGHRHHIVCSGCGTAVSFTFCPMDELVPALARDTAFQIHDHMLEVFGTCPTCQKTGGHQTISP
jgi:Fe2+ or Zn2+ uptake regulation protein